MYGNSIETTKKSIGFNPINEVDCPSKTNSLPCSPKKQPARNRTLRAAKSHDTGLNKSKKPSSSDTYESFFKNRQRLSLTFFDEMDDEDFDSDQDTIILPNISTPPHVGVTAKGAEFEPLRRYNSHESILSNNQHLLSRSIWEVSPPHSSSHLIRRLELRYQMSK